MKFVGYLFVATAILGAALYFGGFVEGKTEVSLSKKGHELYNSGVEQVQQGIGSLKTQPKR